MVIRMSGLVPPAATYWQLLTVLPGAAVRSSAVSALMSFAVGQEKRSADAGRSAAFEEDRASFDTDEPISVEDFDAVPGPDPAWQPAVVTATDRPMITHHSFHRGMANLPTAWLGDVPVDPA